MAFLPTTIFTIIIAEEYCHLEMPVILSTIPKKTSFRTALTHVFMQGAYINFIVWFYFFIWWLFEYINAILKQENISHNNKSI
jgi:hypothetical protein